MGAKEGGLRGGNGCLCQGLGVFESLIWIAGIDVRRRNKSL
jgi:hypothetical protein